MNIKQFILFLLVAVCARSAYAMKKSRLQPELFKELMDYSSDFLQANKHRLACQKNESGFVRINIPILTTADTKFKNVKKLRLNYWSPDTGVIIRPESIHTHPNYFESLVIKGGYKHELYEDGESNDQEYELYRLIKKSDKKSFIFIGQSKLKYLREESVRQNTIVTIDKDLIHRVTNTLPETLSLNAVFNEERDEDDGSYNLYLTRSATLDDVKTTRDVLSSNQSKRFIHEIIAIINEKKINNA